MASLRKTFKQYERYILLGLVILLLGSFSITGAMRCAGPEQPGTYGLGGSFEVAPGERMDISDAEYDERYDQYRRMLGALRLPSLEFARYFFGAKTPDPWKSAWLHIIGLEVARHAGYEVGEHQVAVAAKEMATLWMMINTGMPFSESNYQQFLRQQFGGSITEWQRLVRQMVLKDMAIAPLIESARYSVTYPEAYEKWKTSRERVNLGYIALPAEGFAARVKAEELTREDMSVQESSLSRLKASIEAVRRTIASIEDYKGRHEGAWPESLTDLGSAAVPFQVPEDGWGVPVRYTRTDADGEVRSAGPDKEFDTADDVTRATVGSYEAHIAVSRLAGELRRYRLGMGTWPADLAKLREPLGAGKPALLLQPVLDPWGREPVYAAPASAEESPTLTSLGADGAPGGGDDVVAEVSAEGEPDSAAVPLQALLLPYVRAEVKDAWGQALHVRVARANPPLFGVVSAGPDTVLGTADDLKEGNERELVSFYAGISNEYRREPRYDFETLFIHAPLVPDDVLKKLWEAYPDQRPTDEEQVFQWWLTYRGKDLFYKAENPADPVDGHGVAAMKRIAPGAELTLVPAAELFGTLAQDSKADEPNGEEPKDGEPKDGDGDAPGADDSEDPDVRLRREFRASGWREVVIRERFLENLLDSWLKRAMASHEAQAQFPQRKSEWEKAMARWQEENASKPENEQASKPQEPAAPEVVTFQSLLAGELQPYLLANNRTAAYVGDTVQYWRPESPATREAWEANVDIGHPMVAQALNSLREDGQYYRIPVQLNDRITKVLVRRRGYVAPYQPQLDEVREELRPAWWNKRQLDHADQALQQLRKRIDEAEAQSGGDPSTEEGRATRKAAMLDTLETWSAELGMRYFHEETGWFIGAQPPSAVPVPDGMDPAEAGRIRRRNYMWRAGYATVAESTSAQDTVSAVPGTFGRTVVADRATGAEGTQCAYLVRVRGREFAQPAEFSPRRYTEYLRNHVFGDREMMARNVRLRDMEGSYYKALARYLDDLDWMQAAFDLTTHGELHSLEERERR